MGSLCGKPSSPTSAPARNSLLPTFASGYGELDNGEQPAPPNARVAAAAAAEKRNTSTAQKGKRGQQKRKPRGEAVKDGAEGKGEGVVEVEGKERREVTERKEVWD